MTSNLKKTDTNQNTSPEVHQPPITTKQNPAQKTANGVMMESDRIKCVEEHHQSEPEYFSKNTKACKWGKKNGDVNTCADCPFGIMILEFTPAYREYLDHWEMNISRWHWPNKYSHLYQLNGITPDK